MQTVQISKVIKPRGLRGEVKCLYFEKMPQNVFIDGQKFLVKNTLQSGGFTYLILDGISTVQDAERLRGKAIEADRADVRLADDEVLESDLIGFEIVDKQKKHLGVLVSIENFGAGDIINCGTFSFPYEDEFVAETNMTAKQIVLRKDLDAVQI